MMSSEYSGETSSSASASWSWTVSIFISGIFFGTVIASISLLYLYCKSSLQAKFRPPSSHSDMNPEEDGSSTSSTRRPSRWHYRYDVFLSFRGSDCRNFIDHLYQCLLKEGIFAFRDVEVLNIGDSVSRNVQQAIRDSRASIVVFSRNYAASTWCLDEMASIVDSHQELGQVVIPVFYDVDPADVRRQRGPYNDAFIKYAERFKEDPGKVRRWRRAMTCLGSISGWDARYMPEPEVIKDVIQKFNNSTDNKFLTSVDDNLVGMHRVKELEDLLKLNSVIGICGMGGVGKTTYATALYEKICHQFEASCFIRDVRQIYREGGIVAVQKQILHHTLDSQQINNLEAHSSPSEISGLLRGGLSQKRVLIVLDDVDEIEQLEILGLSPNLLGRGSRVIIITRNMHLLQVYGVDAVYTVSLLNDNEAYELLSRSILPNQKKTSNNVRKLFPRILEYTRNLPLAIKVMGSYAGDKDDTHWEYLLKRKASYPIIEEVVQISFETLSPNEKEIFLHIACFFQGEREEYVKRVLDCCGLYSRIGIQVIKDRSLITTRDGRIYMHDVLQQLGKQIVHAECPENPESRTRLWLYQDFKHALISKSKRNKVKAIVLNKKEGIFEDDLLTIEGLLNMRDLQLLILCHINFSGNLKYLSNKLRYLVWHGYPCYSLPLFEPYCRLVELNLPNSSIRLLWTGRKVM